MAIRRVAVLGLGNMGAALVRALKHGGHSVISWNRSNRSGLAADLGISLAPDPAAAIRLADTVITCLSSYSATDQVLVTEGVAVALRGKTLIQLSTGLPAEAMVMAAWAAGNQTRYLDGKIA